MSKILLLCGSTTTKSDFILNNFKSKGYLQPDISPWLRAEAERNQYVTEAAEFATPKFIFDLREVSKISSIVNMINDIIYYAVRGGYESASIDLVWCLNDVNVSCIGTEGELQCNISSSAGDNTYFVDMLSGKRNLVNFEGSITMVFAGDKTSIEFDGDKSEDTKIISFLIKKPTENIKPYSEFIEEFKTQLINDRNTSIEASEDESKSYRPQ